jgi:hypothetical protein
MALAPTWRPGEYFGTQQPATLEVFLVFPIIPLSFARTIRCTVSPFPLILWSLAMADVLKHLHKLRDHEKKQAQMDLAKAEVAEEMQRVKVEENAQKVRQAQENTQENNAAEVARYHAFRLRMEMIRRRESGRLQKRQNKVMIAREILNHSVRQVRTLDQLIENREVETAKEARKVDNELMNELSVQAWWRNTG